MVLWICVGVVVLALVVLAILIFDLVGHIGRLRKAAEVARADVAPYIPVVMSLTTIARPGAAHDKSSNEPTVTRT